MVGEEGWDEGVGCVGDCDAGKGLEEEVRVRVFGVVEGVLAVLDEHVEVVVRDRLVLLQVVQGFEFLDSQAADIAVED